MSYNISELLRDVAKPQKPSNPLADISKSPIEFVFDNLMARLEKMNPKCDFLGQITTPELAANESTQSKLMALRASYLDKVRDLFQHNGIGSVLDNAINFREPAVDFVCRKIVEHFFPQKIYSLDSLKQDIGEILDMNNIERNSDIGLAMINASAGIFSTVQTNRYRAIAFPVLGYDLTDTEFQEFFSPTVKQSRARLTLYLKHSTLMTRVITLSLKALKRKKKSALI
jgi:hypothetical protein